MTDQELKQHGGRRAGAGRKPSLKPLTVVRLLDVQIREQLAELTAHQREASGNPLVSQEQVVAQLIQAAHAQIPAQPHQATTTALAVPAPPLEMSDNQAGDHGMPSAQSPIELEIPHNQDDRHAGAACAPGAAAIAQIRREVSVLLTTLRRKDSVGQREGRRLITLLTELIALHAAQIMPCAVLEELDRGHTDDVDRDQAITMLLERPLEEYRQAYWERDLEAFTAQLATGPIRRQVDHWALINLAVEVSSATMVTNEQSADLSKRLLAKGIDPTRWLAMVDQAAAPPLPLAPAASSGKPVRSVAPPSRPAENAIIGVRVGQGKSHYVGQPGRTFCGKWLPLDSDDATWIRDPAFKPSCRRCQALFGPPTTL